VKACIVVQELHEQEMGTNGSQQGGLQEAQAQVERLTTELARQQRQAQQVCRGLLQLDWCADLVH